MSRAPKEIAQAMIETGKGKAALPFSRLITLAVLAGAYIALGAFGASVAQCTVESASLARLIGASVFPVGLMLVVVGGAELFTGNCLMTLPTLNRDISLGGLFRNLIFAYLGNFVGAALIAWLATQSGLYSLYNGALGEAAIKAGVMKASLPFFEALARGVLCNVLVCGAVWMAAGAKSAPGKMMAAFFPVMLFVLCGFEHSVANMFYLPAALLLKGMPAFAQVEAGALTITSALVNNLLPVTLGNMLGGGALTAAYYAAYIRK